MPPRARGTGLARRQSVAGLAIALFASGTDGVRALAFPLKLPLLAVPLPDPVVARLSWLTRTLAAGVAETTLDLLHIPVVRQGLTLSVGGLDLQVGEACNGCRSSWPAPSAASARRGDCASAPGRESPSSRSR